jgi:hypothetical protein
MSTTEIEPRVDPGAPTVGHPDGLPPGADPHELPDLFRAIVDDTERRICCRFVGPCSCPVPAGDECPVCEKELCSICVNLRNAGRAPYAVR